MSETRLAEQRTLGRLRRIVARVVLGLSSAFILFALGVKYGWGTPLLLLFAIAFAWSLYVVFDDFF